MSRLKNYKETAEENQNTKSNYIILKNQKSNKRFSRMIKTKRKLSQQKAQIDEVENTKKNTQESITFELRKYWNNTNKDAQFE